jgi:quercetin dioxygenase-like cupin family protein
MLVRIANFFHKPTEPMHLSDAKGMALVHNGEKFGADVIDFPPFGEVPMHTHPGDHILLCVGGSGCVTVKADKHPVTLGTCYLIRSMEPHAVQAFDRGLTLVVVGNDHRPVNSVERLDVIA